MSARKRKACDAGADLGGSAGDGESVNTAQTFSSVVGTGAEKEDQEKAENGTEESESEGEEVPRCEQSKEGPTLSEVWEEVWDKVPEKSRNWLNHFEEQCQGYGWIQCNCKFWEIPGCERYAGECAYFQCHGASVLPSNIQSFCGYYIPRKMWSLEKKERKHVFVALRTLIQHCNEHGYLGDPEARDVLKSLAAFTNTFTDEIATGLQKLADEKWWDALEKIPSDEERELAERKRKAARLDNPCPFGFDSDSDEEKYEARFGDADGAPLTIDKVAKDGWVMSDPSNPSEAWCQQHLSSTCPRSPRPRQLAEDPFLRLPPVSRLSAPAYLHADTSSDTAMMILEIGEARPGWRGNLYHGARSPQWSLAAVG